MSEMETVIIARVKRIHTMKRYLNPVSLKIYGTLGLYLTLTSLVSLANVYANMPSLMTPKECLTFVYLALVRTDIAVQVVLLALVVTFTLFVRDITQNLKESRAFSRQFV